MSMLVFLDNSIEFALVTRADNVDIDRAEVRVVEPHGPPANYDRSTMILIMTDERDELIIGCLDEWRSSNFHSCFVLSVICWYSLIAPSRPGPPKPNKSITV